MVNPSVTLEAGGLRVEFIRQADRYRHEIVASAGERVRPWLASLEGTADEAWPASPPWQEVHLERREEHMQVALLVGRAGRSHWSMSVEADRLKVTLTFDIACRCSAPNGWLGSSYKLAESDTSVIDLHGSLLRYSAFQVQVVQGDAQLSEAGDERLLRIAAHADVAPGPQTVRWKYCLGPLGRE